MAVHTGAESLKKTSLYHNIIILLGVYDQAKWKYRVEVLGQTEPTFRTSKNQTSNLPNLQFAPGNRTSNLPNLLKTEPNLKPY